MTEFKPGWLQEQVAKCVAALDRLPAELRQSLKGPPMTSNARFYNDTDNRQCDAVDECGQDCAAPESHDGPHANMNGAWGHTFPQAWIEAAAEAAHKALDEVDDGWHYQCLQDPDDHSCGKGFRARDMLAEDVVPLVLAALDKQGALNR